MKKLLISLVVLFTFAPGKAQDQKELMEKIEALQAQVDSLQQRVDTLTHSHAFLDCTTRLNILNLEIGAACIKITASADELQQQFFHKVYFQERYYMERKNYDAYEVLLQSCKKLHQSTLEFVGFHPQYGKFTNHEKDVLKRQVNSISSGFEVYDRAMEKYKFVIEAYGKLR